MKIAKIVLGTVVLLSLIFLAIGVFATEFTYETSVVVNRPVNHTFAVFTDESKLDDWMVGLKRIENLEGEPLTVGSKWRLVFDENGEEVSVVEEVTEFKENEVFAFSLDTDVFTGTTAVHFIPKGERTEITSTNEVAGKNVFLRSLFWVMKSYFAHRAQESYANLKQVVEAS